MDNNIAALRKERGLSQKELAEKVGISYWWLNHIENGKRRPSTLLLEKIAKALGVHVKDIFLA